MINKVSGEWAQVHKEKKEGGIGGYWAWDTTQFGIGRPGGPKLTDPFLGAQAPVPVLPCPKALTALSGWKT